MDTSPDVPAISYAQLFSFQISYAGAFVRSNSLTSSDDKRGDYRQGILEVDFHMETLFIQDRDRIFMSQSFSTLRNHVDAEYLDDFSISIKFDSDQWNISSQNVAEKTCIQHLLEDKSIQKHGQILRRAANHNKLEERFLILVPGKLLLFKTFDIIGKHARYATSLLGATLRTSPEDQEFQVSAPGSKTLSLISPDPKHFDSWIEAVQASIEYTKQAARAAGMATTLSKKKRRSRGSKSHRVQWDNYTLDKDAQLLERGNDMRSNVEAAQLNQQSQAEPSNFSNGFPEEYYSNTQSRATKQESRDTKDARKPSRAMMCLETALNEMKIAVSTIRTVRLPGPALWHKANLSPPRSYRGLDDHLQSRLDREGRHWQSSLGHNYVDALISPRTRETSQPLRRSWDSTSTVDTGVGLPRVVWRSQTMEDLKTLPPMSREEEILKWRNGSYPTLQVRAKSAASQPITAQQQSARLDLELHGNTSSDDEDYCGSQPRGADMGNFSTRVSSKVPLRLNGLVRESATSLTKNTRMPHEYSASGNAFQPRSDMMGVVDQHASLSQQQFVSSDLTGIRKSTVKSLDLRPSRASKVSFYPQDDVINLSEGESNVPVLDSNNGESGTFNSSSLEFGRLSERDVRAISNAQACPDPTSRNETGLYGRASSFDSQRVPMPHFDIENTPQQPLIFLQSAPSEYLSPNDISSERKSMITEDSQHETAANTRQSQATISSNASFNLRDPYGVVQNSVMVVPNSTLQEVPGQYFDISRRSRQAVGASNASAGEPPTLWESRISSAETAGPLGVSKPTRWFTETTYSQGTIQSAETPNQAGPIPPPSRQHSQTRQYQESTQGMNPLNDPSSRRNSAVSSMPIAEVQLDHFSTSQFSVEPNGALTRGDFTSEGSGFAPNTPLLRNSTVPSDSVAVNGSDIIQTFISGPELLSRRQTHDVLRQQSFLQAGPDAGQRFSQELAYPAKRLSTIESENSIDRASMSFPPGHYPLEREAPAPTHSSHISSEGIMHDQTGGEGYARPQTGLTMYLKQNESGSAINPEFSSASDNIGASRRSEEAVHSVQLNDIAELVNRLVRITAGDEPVGDKANVPGARNPDKGSLIADSLPSSNSTPQDPLSRTWERPASMSRVPGDATPLHHTPPQSYSYELSGERTSVQTAQAPHVMLSSSNQDINPALQLQGFSLLSGNGTSINGPITLKSADGDVIIIGKERRSSTSGLVAAQGAEQVQTNIGVAAQEERLQDSRQPSRRPSLTGNMGSLLNGGDAWSLAILKPGTPAQIFKFETQ